MRPIRALVVEDDPATRDLLVIALRSEGYQVQAAADGAEALALAKSEGHDLAVLDVRLRGSANGLDVLRQLRMVSNLTALVVSGADTRGELMAGLRAGADDYVTKPFDIEELLARIRACLRRSGCSTKQVVLSEDDLVLDPSARRVWRGDVEVDLTAMEFDILGVLLERRGDGVSKRALLEEVWNFGGPFNTVEVHVSHLRHKLEVLGPRLVYTVRSVGYVIRSNQ